MGFSFSASKAEGPIAALEADHLIFMVSSFWLEGLESLATMVLTCLTISSCPGKLRRTRVFVEISITSYPWLTKR